MDTDMDTNMDTVNPQYTLSDFFTENHYGLMGLLLATVLIGVSTGFVLLDLLIPFSTKPKETDEAKRIREYEAGYLDELGALEDDDDRVKDGKCDFSQPEKERLSKGKVEDEPPLGQIIITY